MATGHDPGCPESAAVATCQNHVARAYELAIQLLELSAQSKEACQHDGCRLLNGVVHDCGTKICNLTEWWGRELQAAEDNAKKEAGASCQASESKQAEFAK